MIGMLPELSVKYHGRKQMKTRIAVLAAIVLIAPSILAATDLDQQTLSAWDQYIQAANSQISQSLTGSSAFLWIDGA